LASFFSEIGSLAFGVPVAAGVGKTGETSLRHPPQPLVKNHQHRRPTSDDVAGK
jgi:hypothetical protein